MNNDIAAATHPMSGRLSESATEPVFMNATPKAVTGAGNGAGSAPTPARGKGLRNGGRNPR